VDEYQLVWGYSFDIKTPYKNIYIIYYFFISNSMKRFFVECSFHDSSPKYKGFRLDDYMLYRSIGFEDGEVVSRADLGYAYESYREENWRPQFVFCEYKDYQAYTLRWVDFIKELMATEEIHQWLSTDMHLSTGRPISRNEAMALCLHFRNRLITSRNQKTSKITEKNMPESLEGEKERATFAPAFER